MTNIKKFLGIIIVLVSINVLALNVVPQLQDDRTRQQAQQKDKRKGPATLKRGGKASADSLKKELSGLSLLTIEDDSIPDSLLHPRWKVQRSVPVTIDDVDKRTADLSFPENIKQDVVYNDTLDRYFIG